MSVYPPIHPKAESNRLYDVPFLENDGSNFQMWKYRTITVLRLRGLLPLIHMEGKEEDPGLTASTSKREEWRLRNLEALVQITMTLKDQPLSGVMYMATAVEAFEALERRYEGKGKQTIAYLISDLFRSTLSDESPLEQQLNAMMQKTHILASLGLALEDTLISIAMAISLPPSYETLRTILMTSDSKLTTEKVITEVLNEEKRRRSGSLGSQSALLAKQAKSKAKSEKNKKVKCDFCGITGHIKKECRKFAKSLSQQGLRRVAD